MLEKIHLWKRQGETVSRLALHNRGISMKYFRFWLAGAVFWTGLATTGGAVPPLTNSPDTLVLRSTNLSSLHILTVDLYRKRAVRFRACEELDRLGDCKTVWKTQQRELTSGELSIFRRLAREAKLFSGRANGGQLDFGFRSLEVHARNDIAVLVTSLNDSFFQPGPRRDLLLKLQALDAEMASSSKS
jgi:hypothetical protein